ncbi:MAG: serine hydrolase domain-containing protein [Gemmatimonadaceae bacterium]
MVQSFQHGRQLLGTIAVLFIGIACIRQARPTDQSCVGTEQQRQVARRVDSVFDSLNEDTTHTLKGVLLRQHGCTLAERYFNGDGPTTLHDIRSATKSITSTLVGLAIQQGLVATVDAPLSELLPKGMLPSSGQILLRDVLTMRTGLDSDDRDSLAIGNENRLDESSDWTAFAGTVPLKWKPGERYVYSSFSAFLAGTVVEHASHLPLQEYARRNLFEPIGITRFEWRRGPKGEGVGQGNLSITARDMAAIGELFLNNGRSAGRQVVDSQWVAAALASRVSISQVDPYADAYGYMWYTRRYTWNGHELVVHFASGNGGNKIYIVPAYDLVLTITSSAYGRSYGQRRSEQILLRVLDAFAESGRPGAGQSLGTAR